MHQITHEQIAACSGGNLLLGVIVGYAAGKAIDGLIYCERNWDNGDFGYGTYNDLMLECMTDPNSYGWGPGTGTGTGNGGG